MLTNQQPQKINPNSGIKKSNMTENHLKSRKSIKINHQSFNKKELNEKTYGKENKKQRKYTKPTKPFEVWPPQSDLAPSSSPSSFPTLVFTYETEYSTSKKHQLRI